MNKVHQYISDYRLPAEKPFKEAVGLYWQRVLIICAVTISMMAASALIALVIVAFQAGYGFWVVVVVVIVLFSLRGGGTSGGGGAPGGQAPPSPNSTEIQGQQGEHQSIEANADEVFVTVSRSRGPKTKMLAMDPYDETKPPVVIEVDEEN